MQRKKEEKQRKEEIDEMTERSFSRFQCMLSTRPDHWLEKYLVSLCVRETKCVWVCVYVCVQYMCLCVYMCV